MWRASLVLALGLSGSDATIASQQPAAQDQPPVTVLTGCLRSSGASTEVAGPSGRIYTLEVVQPPPASGATTTGANPPMPSKTTYSLSAAASLELEKHADHEVQLTGRLQAPASTPAKTPGGKPVDPPAPGGGHNTFNVTALKMISTKC